MNNEITEEQAMAIMAIVRARHNREEIRRATMTVIGCIAAAVICSAIIVTITTHIFG